MKKRIKTKGWSEESRRKAAERIRKTRPWDHATGPKSETGKAASAGNSLKSGLHTSDMRALRRILCAQAKLVQALNRHCERMK